MKKTYPIILTPDKTGFTVYIPDFDIGTQGDDLPQAIGMACDAIGLVGVDMQDDGKQLPTPSPMDNIQIADGDMLYLVDVDFSEYYRKTSKIT